MEDANDIAAKGPDDAGQPAEAEAPIEHSNLGFPVVGIGASAGGIAAFEAFFSTMPADNSPGMAFVLVQHLARDHKSILSELVGRYTRMAVFEVVDGMAVKPNCAYIIPPNRDMEISNGTLHLREPSIARGVRLPIDIFFRSLAQDQGHRAICIVLSGTGSDGSLGVRAVKGEGGLVMVQSPETTEYDGMPQSAIATGMVDFVLPPNLMPEQLMAYAGRVVGRSLIPESSEDPYPPDELEKIFLLLRAQTSHDFSEYKRSTMIRRLERRMAVHAIDRLQDYLRYLQLTPKEVGSLFRDLLIGVTNFFRDPDIFEVLEKQVIPRLFTGNAANKAIRIWVPACSTGEEAYSIAILLLERMQEMKVSFKIQVFATDIDRNAIDRARAGVYPASIIADVSAQRLAHFFENVDPHSSSYRIHKTVRDILVFSEHDLIKDPPFSKLDLISCRNLLIYMGPELQKKLMPLFHYALKPEGMLLLGSSESVGESANLFSAVDRKAKIFQRRVNDYPLHRVSVSSRFSRAGGAEVVGQTSSGGQEDQKVPFREIAERTILEHYGPVGALVTERGEILYFLGRTGEFLEPTPGEASMNIFKMAREGLRAELTIFLHRAVSTGIAVRRAGLRFKYNGNSATVNLTVVPVPTEVEGATPRGLFVVLFECEPEALPRTSTEAAVEAAEGVATASLDLDEYIIRLKQELRAKDEHLQTVIEELESSNEELRSAHEEMQSVNEEMQSANEELETSREELQSVNEELATVNGELQTKVADLSQTNNDMRNLLSGTGIGTIFVDHSLRILRFTPTVSALINLIEADVGRPLDQIRSNLVDYDSLSVDIAAVLDSLVPKELEVQTNTGEWFILRIRAYRTLDNVIEGAVITFTDCTAMKLAQTALRDSEVLRRLAVVVRDSRDAIMVQDLSGRILAWNPGAVKMYGWSEAAAMEMNIRSLMPESEREQMVAAVLEHCEANVLTPRRQQRIAKDGRTIEVSIVASALVDDAGGIYAIATTERAVAT